MSYTTFDYNSLVGFNRLEWIHLSNDQVSENLGGLQKYVIDAHKSYPNVPVDLINAVIVHESKGAWNAVSPTGALGVMQLTADNYFKGRDANFNPFNTEKSINYGVRMLSGYLTKFGTTQIGVSKTLAAYNLGEFHVLTAIKQYGNDWLSHIYNEGKAYIKDIAKIRNNELHIPGYFGGKK